MPACVDAVALADSFDQAHEQRALIALEQARIAVWRQVDPNAVGILLPLSGPYAKFGEAAKEAVDLALKEAGSTLRVVVRDTGGDADKARALATELVLSEHVAVLLGPIGRKESAAVAEIARLLDVPLVPLTSEIPPLTAPAPASPDPLLNPAPSDPVLRLRTSPSELVTAIARHARTELGVVRAAMFVPDTDAGREAALAFRTELERLGGVIVREVSFDPSAKALTEPLKALMPPPGPPPKRGKKPKIKADFDTLFIPADALVVRRIAPLLAYTGLHPRTVPGDTSRIQLLGTSGWNHPGVVDKGEHLTNNAVFADVFAPDDSDAQDFGRRFFLHLQRRPTAFHAEVWDATRLVVDSLGRVFPTPAAPVATRATIRDTFATPRMLVGATGPLEVTLGGRMQPRAHLMTIDGDEIRARLSEDEERARRTTTTPPESP